MGIEYVNSLGCGTPLPYICEAKMTYTPPDEGASDPRGDLLDCYYGEHEYGKDCIKIHTYPLNWYDAESRCTRDRKKALSLYKK